MCQSFYYRPQSWTTRRSTEDFADINGFSMMVFIILMALLTHGHGMSFQDRCLGFPKRPCFPKFMKMVAHGAPVTDGLDEFRSLRSEDTKRYTRPFAWSFTLLSARRASPLLAGDGGHFERRFFANPQRALQDGQNAVLLAPVRQLLPTR